MLIGIFRYVRTPILSQDIQDYLNSKGVEFALVEDSAKAMLNIASDVTINGRFDCVPHDEKRRKSFCVIVKQG
jgi:hypothetical protein